MFVKSLNGRPDDILLLVDQVIGAVPLSHVFEETEKVVKLTK